MAQYVFYINTGIHGSQNEELIEIPDKELEGMTEEEIHNYIHENYFEDWLANNTDMGFYKEED